jgi:hypothetical protein
VPLPPALLLPPATPLLRPLMSRLLPRAMLRRWIKIRSNLLSVSKALSGEPGRAFFIFLPDGPHKS